MMERVKFIEDLPEDWQSLVSSELSSVGKIWREQSERLNSLAAVKKFNERLRREWAIETGIIEGLYTIDRGITQILIERGIEANLIPSDKTDRPVDLVVAMVGDQEEALEGLFDFVSHGQELTTSYIKQLHQVFTRNQHTVTGLGSDGHIYDMPLLKGAWKMQPNNPSRSDGTVHYYTPPEHVSSEMDRLLLLHREHTDKEVSPEVEAAWLHHRFAQIHPFQDGNGRIARTLASLIFIRSGLFPLVITRDTRADYIEALETADGGNLSPLVDFFAKMQTRAFRQAVSISEPLLRQHESISDIIAAGAKSLRSKHETQLRRLQDVFALAEELKLRATTLFDETSHVLDWELKAVDRSYTAKVDASNKSNEHWFRHQIITIAKTKSEENKDYYADLFTYSAWTRIKISIGERTTQLVLSFHSLGIDFLGVLVASAFIEFRDRSEHKEIFVDGPYAISNDIFQFGYDEEPRKVKERFDGWVNEVILIGLDEWRKQL